MNQPEQQPDTLSSTSILTDAEVVIGEATIERAILQLADALNHRYSSAPYQNSVITVFCIMNGGLYFSGQLLKHLTFPLKVDYLHATRYGDKTRGSTLNWFKTPTEKDTKGQHVLLLDDIFDEGLTLEAIDTECRHLGALSVNSAVLTDKQHKRKPVSGFKPDFIGLDVEDRYIFGCGMDYKGLWRNLPAIYALKS
ncbi:hypoxanthine-guanine phosphoribosyltransferase [Kangiella shandongensis]|uniref:hypoxanthine-guanine phosphoribosyltransferase n=1 Tax=Kangiella shandongensis TaxID=2763258 RepID=UPI001CBF733A|nr:hypoxanthine-guanine phosphoribosyltransferase [Kangiella shandongensis]